MNIDVLREYFTDGVTPQDFLDELHDIMAEYSMMAMKDEEFNAGVHTARHIGFLSNLYDAVRQAART